MPPFVFKLQAPVVQKVTDAIHWINLSIKRIVQLVSLILYVLWITISPVDKKLGQFLRVNLGCFHQKTQEFWGLVQLRNILAEKLENNDVIFSGFIAC